MNNEFAGCPVIIVGMHRSGTSVLCRMLDDLGLFCGNDQSKKNHESYFFVEVNRWLFEQCGATWDRPLAARELYDNKQLFEGCKLYLSQVLQSKYFSAYGGANVKGGLYVGATPWGWKDPRSTFTLPLWLALFPEAKVINVYRNGVDVANSLQVREKMHLEKRIKSLAEGKELRKSFLSKERLSHRKLRKLVMSLRCSTLDGGLSLWEEYMAEADAQVEKLGARALNVNYEELLKAPEDILGEICLFCGLTGTKDKLLQAASGLNPARACAYLKDPILKKFAEENHGRLERW
jgi:hypothetical protein